MREEVGIPVGVPMLGFSYNQDINVKLGKEVSQAYFLVSFMERIFAVAILRGRCNTQDLATYRSPGFFSMT